MSVLHHFSLSRHPFDNRGRTGDIFPSGVARETQARLRHLLELRGIGMLVGESGTGKTTACRTFTDALPAGSCRVAYVALSTGSVLDTYRTICWQFGLPPEHSRSAFYRALHEEMRRLAREAGQLPLLIVDDAHNLRNEVLEDLRLLTSFRMDSEKCLCLLLSGHVSLRERIDRMSMHDSLRQRIAVRCVLGGLERDEIRPYLAHRLKAAGCDRELFETEAADKIFELTRGLPRVVNSLAHYSLAGAACDQAAAVTVAHVEKSRGDAGL